MAFQEVLEKQKCSEQGWAGFLPAAAATLEKKVPAAKPARRQSSVVQRKQFGAGLPAADLSEPAEPLASDEEDASPLSSTDDFSLAAWSADDPLSLVEGGSRAQAEEARPSFKDLTQLRASWQELQATPAAASFLTTPLAELKGRQKFTPRQLGQCEEAGLATLGDVVHYYPRGYTVATPGQLPTRGDDAAGSQSISILARLRYSKVSSYGQKGAYLFAVFDAVHPEEAGVPAPALPPDAYAGRSVTVVLERYRPGWKATQWMNNNESQFKAGVVALSGSVSPRDSGDYPGAQRSAWSGCLSSWGPSGDGALTLLPGAPSPRPAADSWTVKDPSLVVAPVGDEVRALFSRGDSSIETSYTARGGIDSKQVQALVGKALKALEGAPERWGDPLPDWMRRRYRLCGYLEALKVRHGGRQGAETLAAAAPAAPAAAAGPAPAAAAAAFRLGLLPTNPPADSSTPAGHALPHQRAGVRVWAAAPRLPGAPLPPAQAPHAEDAAQVARGRGDWGWGARGVRLFTPARWQWLLGWAWSSFTRRRSPAAAPPLPTPRLPQRKGDLEGVAVTDLSLVDLARRTLPYALTPAQQRAVEHVLGEMEAWPPMLCLLQGDVGCGKTVVALLAVLAAVGSGYQAAVMAPTEILAEQHYRSMARMLADLNRQATEEGIRGEAGGGLQGGPWAAGARAAGIG